MIAKSVRTTARPGACFGKQTCPSLASQRQRRTWSTGSSTSSSLRVDNEIPKAHRVPRILPSRWMDLVRSSHVSLSDNLGASEQALYERHEHACIVIVGVELKLPFTTICRLTVARSAYDREAFAGSQ